MRLHFRTLNDQNWYDKSNWILRTSNSDALFYGAGDRGEVGNLSKNLLGKLFQNSVDSGTSVSNPNEDRCWERKYD